MLKPKLHETQKTVALDKHRFRVVNAGRRWGKSTLAQLTALKWATDAVGTVWIVSPTYRQSKQIHWRGLQQIVPREWILRKNEVELSITLKNGSVIELKGAENPDALRGVKLRGLIPDEVDSIRNWQWLWDEVLRATLTDYVAPALFIGTPKGYGNLFNLREIAKNNPDYAYYHFTSYDNPYIPKEEIDNAKKELTENTFHQEYMADFRKYTGLVYKDFDRQVHVIEPFEIPESWRVYRGLDFGSTNPTAVLFIAVDNDDNWYICSEHYEVGQTIDYHAGRINANSFSSRVQQSFGDPSGAQWIQEFAQRGIYITPANKEVGQAFSTWVTFGIDKVAQRLKIYPGRPKPYPSTAIQENITGYPSLFIFKMCTNTIREMETYRWKEKSVTQAQDLNEPDAVEKANDHAMDALRYFAVSYKKIDREDQLPTEQLFNTETGFY